MKYSTIISFLFLLSSAGMAAPADLDATFGDDGVVRQGFGGGRDIVSNVVLQPDGKILAVGSVDDNLTDFLMTRFLADGSPDTSFGDDGVVTADLGGTEVAHDAAIQGDGKIVVVGRSSSFQLGNFAVVARYLADGQIDQSFGDDGFVKTDFFEGQTEEAREVYLYPDGRILIVGQVSLQASFLGRYLPDGSPDPTFGTNGRVLTPASAGRISFASIALQENGKIVAGGSIFSSKFDFCMARYLDDGSIDTSFGIAGYVQSELSAGGSFIDSVLINDDATIVAAGSIRNAVNTDYGVARYLPDGTLDNSFGTAGSRQFALGDRRDQTGKARLQPDGKIVLVGVVGVENGNILSVIRLLPNGSYDVSFDSDGFAVSTVSPTGGWGTAVALQPDGRIIAAGYSEEGSENVAVLRFLTDGALDASFGEAGIVKRDIANAIAFASDTVVQPDGKVIVVGLVRPDFSSHLAVVTRYLTNGRPDLAFGERGRVFLAPVERNNIASAVALQSDGKILVAGSGGNPFDYIVSRLLPDGTLDASFGIGGHVVTELSENDDEANDIAVQADGKILVTGSANEENLQNFGTVRYLSDGSLDTAFGTGGIVLTTVAGRPNIAKALAVQPDGHIVVAGTTYSGRERVGVVRYLPSGDLDTTFSGDGKIVEQIGTGDGIANAVSILPDGEILVAGTLSDSFAAFRYLADGTDDNSFGSNGIVTLTLERRQACEDMVLLPDGRFLLGGHTLNESFLFEMVAVRCLEDGSLDTTFGDGGLGFYQAEASTSRGYALDVSPAGNYFIAGDAGSLFGTLKLVGDAVLIDLPTLMISYVPGGEVHLSFTAEPGDSYRIERSLDLKNGSWVDLGQASISAGNGSFQTPSVPSGRAFYRLRLE